LHTFTVLEYILYPGKYLLKNIIAFIDKSHMLKISRNLFFGIIFNLYTQTASQNK